MFCLDLKTNYERNRLVMLIQLNVRSIFERIPISARAGFERNQTISRNSGGNHHHLGHRQIGRAGVVLSGWIDSGV